MSRLASKYSSRTTPGHKMNSRTWLAELLVLRSNDFMLPENFWKTPKYKWHFANEIKSISKFIKAYGEKLVSHLILNTTITTFTDYAFVEFLIQNELAKAARLDSPKDTSELNSEDISPIKDLRESRKNFHKQGLFLRLKELEDGES